MLSIIIGISSAKLKLKIRLRLYGYLQLSEGYRSSASRWLQVDASKSLALSWFSAPAGLALAKFWKWFERRFDIRTCWYDETCKFLTTVSHAWVALSLLLRLHILQVVMTCFVNQSVHTFTFIEASCLCKKFLLQVGSAFALWRLGFHALDSQSAQRIE